MQQYDGVNSAFCDATESDWLDVSYANNYVEDTHHEQKQRKHRKIKLKKPLKIAVFAVLSLAVIGALLLIDNGGVLTTARTTYLTVLDVFDKNESVASGKIELPANVELLGVENGVATFGGGRVLLSFTDGKVSNIGENTITVDLDDKTQIMYSGVTDVFVKVGDVVTANSLLAKYSESVGASVIYNGTVIEKVIGSENLLSWNV